MTNRKDAEARAREVLAGYSQSIHGRDETAILAAMRVYASEVQREAIERAGGWQPIETAPKDGTEVDLWLVDERGRGWRQADAYYVEEKPVDYFAFYGVARGGWFASEQNGFCDQPVKNATWVKATHWMPRPDAPAIGDPVKGEGL